MYVSNVWRGTKIVNESLEKDSSGLFILFNLGRGSYLRTINEQGSKKRYDDKTHLSRSLPRQVSVERQSTEYGDGACTK